MDYRKSKKQQDQIKFWMLLLAMLLLCVAPMGSSLYEYSRTHVEVERQGIQYASVKNTEVTQKIYCNGQISHLGVGFYAPSGQLYGDAIVTITLSQGDYAVSESVKAAKLRTLSFYEVNPETEREENSPYEMTYVLRTHFRNFSEGEATVSIISYNLPEGTDLFCEVSSTLVSGLPSAMAGENVLGNPIVLEYDVLRTDAHFWYETGLLLVLVFILILTAWLLVCHKTYLDQHEILFFCACIIIFLVVSIRNPYASFWGEPRSEAVYEFWYKAENMGLFGSMMSLMSGEALAWWERILMWIANSLVPRKYVFVFAQLLELSWISLVTAMPCLRSFRRFFRDEVRLAVSLFMGTALLFDSAYYFWSCSYWALFFFILFPILPLERLKPAMYWGGIALTVILCISRIYHILLVPIALILILAVGKKRGRRFTVYCWVVAAASLFECVFSFAASTVLVANSNPLQNVLDIGLWRMIENVLYYQLQVINSFFTGATHWQGSGPNMLSALFLLCVLGCFIGLLIHKRWNMAAVLGSLGFISLGSIAVNVYTSGSYAAVRFPRNYADTVDWGKTIYQEADLHFSYSYICLFFILLFLMYLLEQYSTEQLINRINGAECASLRNGLTIFFNVCIVLTCCTIAAFSVKPRLSYDKICVEWKSVYDATEQNPYFLAINTFYGAAPISLEEGTDEMVFGVDENGMLYEWHNALPAYALDTVYHEAEIGAVSEAESRPILSVTARRSLTNFDVAYVAILKDRDGNELARVAQAQTDHRLWLDFLLPQPITGVYSISFELDDGNTAYIQDGMQVGYIL